MPVEPKREAVDRSRKLSMAYALVLAGLPKEQAAEVFGLNLGTLTRYINDNARTSPVGVGPTPLAASAHRLLNTVVAELDARYATIEDFGDPSRPKDVRAAAQVLRNLLAYPMFGNEMVEQVALRAVRFLQQAVEEHGHEFSDQLLRTIGAAVAPFVQKNLAELRRSIPELQGKERKELFVAAEDVVQTERPQSLIEPELDERAQRILDLTGYDELPPPS